MTEQRHVSVTFSPPTPNGDFHLGHLAGPVLASDICAKSQQVLGNDVTYAVSTDDNQTYVVTTAQRVGTSPEALIDEAHRLMRRSLDLAGVQVDLFERPDKEYEDYVRGFFTHLWKFGAFDRRVVELPYDAEAGEYRAEAFVTGRCPTCLAHARAGVCEACGLYNLPGELLAVSDTASALPRKPVGIWVLDLERYRSMISHWYQASAVQLRPDLDRVVIESLGSGRRLPYIPITYPSTWGIAVDWDGPDSEPQAINAWPEIYTGHQYWLAKGRGARPSTDEWVQFIGIDNGFYNAFVYVALSLLAVRHGLPIDLPLTRTVTNQYFLLAGRKFSTSKGDVRWAGEYLAEAGRDRARFVLALTSPELQQSEFTEQVASATLATRFDAPLAAIEQVLNTTMVHCGIDAEASTWWYRALAGSLARFESAYNLDTFSIRKAAEALALHLEVLAVGLSQIRTDDAADVAGALLFLWALRTLAWPVTPDLAGKIAAAFGADPNPPSAPLLRDTAVPPAGRFRGIALSHNGISVNGGPVKVGVSV
ncbi:methionyl-tRNA synthetase [Kibdelosporangium banguiense]|uniref:Methionyl-tRNA synthetase n=1 Tax=Kibdelosporangium banguiense TaxID=1365924 RepID=A0ABS4TS48_9PSEU|nr:class I tRNA ligase family protein [Kibdelosporangium banguiense]MBP2327235.1 methionyl-tRNA synthetase [Kibdelosporangium banguiense]